MDISKLKGTIPDSIYNQIPGILPFGIDGPKRLSNFLGQCKHESMSFTHFVENLNYSVSGLLTTFPTHFGSVNVAANYSRQPEKIANHIYANRMGNGDENSGDGWKYRGRGALQLTGKNNYKALGDFLNIDLLSNPDLVATDYQLASGAFFFKNNNLWPLCDKGVDAATVSIVTHHVNGGDLGINDRIAYTQEFYEALTR